MQTLAAGNTGVEDRDASDRFVRQPEVLTVVGVSWRTLLRWERDGRFPKRYKIGPRRVGWKESEIKQWFAEQGVAATTARPSI